MSNTAISADTATAFPATAYTAVLLRAGTDGGKAASGDASKLCAGVVAVLKGEVANVTCDHMTVYGDRVALVVSFTATAPRKAQNAVRPAVSALAMTGWVARGHG